MGLAPLSDGAVVVYGLQAQGEALRAHLAQGGRAVFMQDDAIVLSEAGVEISLLAQNEIAQAIQADGLGCVLAALATVWALDLDVERMRVGLRTWNARKVPAVDTAPAL
jgi:cyanophycin synthetase